MGFNQKFCPALKDLVWTAGLCDVFRVCHPRLEEFTFFRAGSAASRLDRFYISDSIKTRLLDVQHVASLSDHCAIKMSLKLNLKLKAAPKQNRKTYWKLNNAILNDDEFMPSFVSFWQSNVEIMEKYQDAAEWWDKFMKP